MSALWGRATSLGAYITFDHAQARSEDRYQRYPWRDSLFGICIAYGCLILGGSQYWVSSHGSSNSGTSLLGYDQVLKEAHRTA